MGLRGLFGSIEDNFPWRGNFIARPRLKDWLALLDFEITEDRLCCYAPPFSQEKWLKRFSFMETAGDRWWPFSGGVYFLNGGQARSWNARDQAGVERGASGQKTHGCRLAEDTQFQKFAEDPAANDPYRTARGRIGRGEK